MSRKVLYIAGCIPTLTCTFIQREIFDLRELGFEIDTVSMNFPPAGQVSKEAVPLIDDMIFLDRVSELRKILALLQAIVTRPRAFFRCLAIFFTAKPMRSRHDYLRLGYHLIESCYLAIAHRSRKPDHIHCHFVHGPTSLGMFLSELIAVPFSFTMHASLIWNDPLALLTKLRRCKFCVSISEYNKQHVLTEYDRSLDGKIHVIYCGIRPVALPLLAARTKQSSRISVLAVGQLKRRKGFHVLIDAAKILKDRGSNISWTIVGEGDQRPRLERSIEAHGLQNDVFLAGAQLHEAIPSFLSNADIFALPCVIGDDNTRDGIPVSLMEAMACGLPVVSTNLVGLPELIRSGHDGILVEPDDAPALAEAVLRLAESEPLRIRLGAAAAAKIDRDFNSVQSAKQLAGLLQS